MLTSVPVSVLGNVYSSLALVQGQSGDLAVLGAQLGMPMQVQNSPKFAMLVQFYSGSTYESGIMAASDGSALKLVADPVTSSLNYIVDATSAVGNLILGVNDNSLSVVPKGYYFWITTSGPAQILLATTIAAGTIVGGSATAGTLAANAGGFNNIVSLASSGSGGKTDCYIKGI